MKLILNIIFILSCLSAFSQVEMSDNYKRNIEKDSRLFTPHRASSDYDVNYYFLDISMDNQSIYIEGTARIDLTTINPDISSIDLDFDNAMNIDEVRLNGTQTAYVFENNEINIPLSKSRTNESYTVEVDYHGTPPYGMFNKTDNNWNEKTTFSLSEPFDAMGWFPVKQDLTDKADSSSVFITIPDNLMAGSNGLLTNITDLEDGNHRFEWKSSYPIDYYLISIAIGNYQDISFYAHPEGTEDSVLIQNYIYDAPSYLSANSDNIYQSADILETYSEKYGLYPHHQEKYGHSVAKLNGGMEHQTMTTLGYFNFTLVAHEMGHSWFGNYITCASWQDIWINEGFAVYSEYIASQNLRTEQESRAWLESSMNTAKDYSDGSVYIPIEEATSVSRIFDYVLTYKKGGMLVHMIRYLINNDEVFFDVLQNHLQTYGDSVATGENFRNILETVSGQDFEIFFDEWYYGEGYPTYESNWYQENDTIYLSNIETTSSETTSLFTIPIEYKINFSNGESSYIRLSQDVNYVEHKISETRNVESIEIDPDMWILCDKSIQQVSAIDIQKISASVSPNPSNGQFIVQLNKTEPLSVEIYNSQGQNIVNFKSDESLINIDLTNNKSGIYLLLLTNKFGNQKHIKLIKY